MQCLPFILQLSFQVDRGHNLRFDVHLCDNFYIFFFIYLLHLSFGGKSF